MRFSFVYSKLVRDPNNLAQMVAYSLYKAEKITYIEEKRKEKADKSKKKIENVEIEESDLEPFNASINQARLNSYLREGHSIVQVLTNNIAAATIRNEDSKRFNELLEKAKQRTAVDWAKEIGIGALGSILGAVLSWIIACTHFNIPLWGDDDEKGSPKQEQKATAPAQPEYRQASPKTAK